MVEPGDIVISPTTREQRVVVDVADYRHEEGYEPSDESTDALRQVICVLRYPDGDPRREFDPDGGDVHLFSETAADVEVVGRI